MKLASERAVTGGFVFAIVLLSSIGVASYVSLKTLTENQRWVNHTHKVIETLSVAQEGLQEAETERSNYALQGKVTDLKQDYTASIQKTEAAIQLVRKLTRDNPNQQRRLDQLEPIVTQQLNLLQRSIDLLQQKPNPSTQIAISQQIKSLHQTIRAQLLVMVNEERRLLQERTATSEIGIQQTIIVLGIGYCLCAVLLSGIFLILKRQVRERQRAEATLQQLNDELEVRIQERTAELAETNAILRSEVIERKQAERKLQRSQEELEIRVQARTQELMTVNTALQAEVNERLEAQQQLQRLAEDLQRSNQELEQFAYVASHDLQEPLRTVTSYTQMLARKYQGNLDDKADKYIGYVVDGATRMQQLISDLLSYSRVGRQHLQRQLTDLNSLVNQALKNLQIAIAEGSEITVDPLPTLYVDPTQISQLLQNLIGNALKYRSQAVPKIHIAAQQQEQEWLFSVQDNGIGIEPQYAERIFVIFQRLHTRRNHPGTGIGLAICKKIVERHHGKIWLESQPGEGSTFYFTLPTTQQNMTAEANFSNSTEVLPS